MPPVLSPLQSSCHSLPHTAFFPIFLPLHSEHFISPCHLSFLSESFLHSRELFYPSNQDPKTLAFKSLTVSAFLSYSLDLSISFLSHFACVSLSLPLFSISIFLSFFCLSSILDPPFSLSPSHHASCLNLISSLATLSCCHFDLLLPDSDKQPVWWV